MNDDESKSEWDGFEGLKHLAESISGSLRSPNETDSNGETANVVDGLYAIARGLDRLARALESRKCESR